MKVKPNSWVSCGYEGWFDGEFVLEIDSEEISLEKSYRYFREILVHVIGPYVALGVTIEDMETLFSLLSETESKNKNKQIKNKRRIKQ